MLTPMQTGTSMISPDAAVAYVDLRRPEARTATQPRPGVMVVDDERGIRAMLYAWLRRKGFAVWLAATGREALGVYRRYQETIDVVLMDVCMPDSNGPKTLAKLKTMTPAVRCCFMSGNLGQYTEPQLIQLGAATIIRKPFCLDEVARVLSNVARYRVFEPTKI